MASHRDRLDHQEYLESFVEPDTNGGCWLWSGSLKAPDSYGKQHRAALPSKAHRASYVVHVGPIPAGLSVLHTCDVPCCINPAHLFLGTQQDNVDDMLTKGRGIGPRRVVSGARAKLSVGRQIGQEENRRSQRSAGQVKRADYFLLPKARREGWAKFCRKCDGDGLVVYWNARIGLDEPIKCARCGGEGLEPKE